MSAPSGARSATRLVGVRFVSVGKVVFLDSQDVGIGHPPLALNEQEGCEALCMEAAAQLRSIPNTATEGGLPLLQRMLPVGWSMLLEMKEADHGLLTCQ